MIYTKKIKDAIRFATKTHEVYQQQKRKGKDIPYITHPLTVGLILARAGAEEDVIVAGILHDTIEDSIQEKKVTKEMLTERFGEKVTELVLSVTEQNKELPWEERKAEALKHVQDFSRESILLKSADVIANVSELAGDYERDGNKVFERFNASKEKILKNSLEVIRTIIECWPENPIADEISFLAYQLQMVGAKYFMLNYRAPVIEYRDYERNKSLVCPVCGWHGVTEPNTDSHFALDVSCPICDKMLLVAGYPLAKGDDTR